MGKRFQVLVEFPTMPQAMTKLGVDKTGRVQQYVTDEVVKNLPDFMPRDTGNLIDGMKKKDDWHVHVAGPYARFLFFGITESGKAVDYSRQKNPKGGPNWDRRMVAERGSAIVAGANRRFRSRR